MKWPGAENQRRALFPIWLAASVLILLAWFAPGYFTRFDNDFNLRPQGLAPLYGLDGVVRARKIGSKEAVGTNASTSPVFASIAQQDLTGAFALTRHLLHIRRIMTAGPMHMNLLKLTLKTNERSQAGCVAMSPARYRKYCPSTM